MRIFKKNGGTIGMPSLSGCSIGKGLVATIISVFKKCTVCMFLTAARCSRLAVGKAICSLR